jgi:threonine/homoserine/homoserine lactone efflux protein
MIIAAKSYFVEDDPDAPPPKWITTIDDLGLGKLFAFGFLISIFQPRLVMLMLVGTAYISVAQLPWDQAIILMFVLILGMIWSQLVPLIVTSMNAWLTHNQHMVNAVILGLFGIVILVDGLSRIFSRGL